jgi:hypothetical protein
MITVSIFKADYTDSGWLELLKELGEVGGNTDLYEVYDVSGEYKEEFTALFASDTYIDIKVYDHEIKPL